MIATALSLLLCVATAVLWARSYGCCDDLEYARLWQVNSPDNDPPTDRYVRLILGSTKGEVQVELGYEWMDARYLPAWKHVAGPPINSRVPSAGFFFSDLPHSVYVACPWWSLTCITTVLPVGFAVRRWSRRSQLPSECPICGYDLRATRDRCPECGTVVVRKVTA
jgi:hypothetical protein